MSDDEADPELLALLAKSLGLDSSSNPGPPEIPVLKDAEFIYDNSVDVALDMKGTKAAASSIHKLMQTKGFSTSDWSKHELHPKAKEGSSTVDFIFLMDLLNFSFWCDGDGPDDVFIVAYGGEKRTGYWSLVACIQRALAEDIPITTPSFWTNETECTDDLLRHVFRSDTSTPIPLLSERIHMIREAGDILTSHFSGTFMTCITQASGSAAALIDLLVTSFPSLFSDTHSFEGRTVHLYKRAQILVADLWACFEGNGPGHFEDIDSLTMFADYRIPQMLHTLGCLTYSPSLESHIRHCKLIPSGSAWEIELRGCSVWCVELLCREIRRLTPPEGEKGKINAVLIDFFLYDTFKEREREGKLAGALPHHRTRSIWY